MKTTWLRSFVEADTDHKIKIGGKGVGRFVCLKTFDMMQVSSQFLSKDNQYKLISFDFKPTKVGFENIKTSDVPNTRVGT